MTYIDLNQKEDMQDDAFKIVSMLIVRCIMSKNDFLLRGDRESLKVFFSEVQNLFFLVAGKLKTESEKVKIKLHDCENQLFDIKGTCNNAEVYTELRKIFSLMCSTLDKEGLLFRQMADTNTLVTHRSS